MRTKTALVSGGAMGYKDGGPSIGGAIALRLGRDGYRVAVLDKGEAGQQTANLIAKAGGTAIFIMADVLKSMMLRTQWNALNKSLVVSTAW